MNEEILRFLKSHGEQLDAQIAQALKLPMVQLQTEIAQLQGAGEIICCNLTRFSDGQKIEGTSCRLSCDTPTATRGRKAAATRKDKDDDADFGV